MDEIIWDSESLQSIASALSESSNQLEENAGILRRWQNEVPLALKDSTGTLLGDVLDQAERAIRQLAEASDRAAELARTVRYVDALFDETEHEVMQLYEGAPVSGKEDMPVSSVRWEVSTQVSVSRGLAERTVAAPEWLSAAAETFFRGTEI